MPDIKISDLTAATAASGAQQLEVNDAGTSKSVTVDQIKAYVLPDDSITAAKIAADAVGSSEIAAGAVGTSELADGAVTSIKVADSSISTTKIANNAVDLTTKVTGVLPVANGGTGTATPSLVAGSNITISGAYPNQTINASVPTGGVTSLNGATGAIVNNTYDAIGSYTLAYKTSGTWTANTTTTLAGHTGTYRIMNGNIALANGINSTIGGNNLTFGYALSIAVRIS